MKIKKSKRNEVAPAAELDYESLIVDHNGDPFSFLRDLKNGNDSGPSDDFDPESLSNGKARRATSFNEDMLLKEVDIAGMVRGVLDENALVPKDVKIDDGDMPLAKNFYEWVSKDSFAGTVMTPFIEQLIWGVVLFGEWCARCSDNDWLLNTHKADDTFTTFEQKVCMLEHGVCPACKVRKSELVRNGEMPFYQELAVNAGQRCVTGDTLTLTEDGLMRMGEYAHNKPYGFSRFHKHVHNGSTLEQTSDFYRAKPERVYRMTLSNGQFLLGTGDHPIKQWDRGFVRLQNTKIGDLVPVYINQQQFGNKHIYFEDVIESVENMYREDHARVSKVNGGKAFRPTSFKRYKGAICSDLYKVLGFWVAEGRGSIISNDDPEVLDFCYNTLTKYINSHHVKLGKHGVKVLGYKGKCFLASLLGGSVKDLTSGSAKKEIPLCVRQSTKENVCAFLQGLYEGDGGTGKYNEPLVDGKGIRIGYASISRQLIQDISAMLNNLGIAHTMRKRYSWATNGTDKQVSKPYHAIGIKGSLYVERFREQVGFLSNRKRTKLDQSIEHVRQNEVPFLFENLNPIKPQVLSLLDRFDSELKEHSLPYTERALPEKYRTYKSGHTMGLATVYGRSSEKLSFSLRKLRKDPSRALTRSKLKELCSIALTYSTYMSESTIDGFKRLEALTSDDVILTRVKKVTLSKDTYETYDFTLPETHQFITGGILSHNSGKSAATGGMLTPYITHRVLKMQKPNDVYGIAGSTMLHGTFVALTYAQAKETLWEFYYGTLCESKWFQQYHGMLRFYEERYGQSLLKFNDTFVVYRPRSLMFYPAGPDKRVLRGRTRIFAGIDEIGWFDNAADSKKVKTSAREVYTALDRSLLTVRGSADRLINSGFDNILTGISANVSSPSSQRDKICELVRQSQDSVTMYGIHRPTWEVNPTLPRNSKVIVSEYQKNPLDAERDYGANPPLSANPYITNKDWIENALGEKPNKIKIRDVVKNRKRQGSATKWAEVEKVGKSRKPSMLTIDAGYTNNSFACAVGHLDKLGNVVVTLLFEIIPETGIPLNYSMILEEVLEDVLDAQNSQVVLADRWNSIKILQDIEQGMDILAEQYSLKYKDIGLTKSFLEAGMLKLPRFKEKKMTIKEAMELDRDNYPMCYKGSPVEHLVLQMLTVQDTGNQVNKGDGLTDDLWRALCLLTWGLTNERYDEFLHVPDAPEEEEEGFRPQAFGVSKLGSGGGSSVGSSSGGVSFNGSLGVMLKGR